MDLLGFLRRRPSAPDPPAPEPPAGPVYRAPAWQAAAPLQRTVAAPELITAPARFRTELVAWADPSVTGAPAHVVSPEAPSGLGHGLAVPAPPARPDPPTPPAPPSPAPLQRDAAGPGRAWRRLWSRDTPVGLQRATGPAAGPVSPLASDAQSPWAAPSAGPDVAPAGEPPPGSDAVEPPRSVLPVVAAPRPAPALDRADHAPVPPPVPRPAVPLQRSAVEPPAAPRSAMTEIPVPGTPPAVVPAAAPPPAEAGVRAGGAQGPATVQRTASPAPAGSRPVGPSPVDTAAPASVPLAPPVQRLDHGAEAPPPASGAAGGPTPPDGMRPFPPVPRVDVPSSPAAVSVLRDDSPVIRPDAVSAPGPDVAAAEPAPAPSPEPPTAVPAGSPVGEAASDPPRTTPTLGDGVLQRAAVDALSAPRSQPAVDIPSVAPTARPRRFGLGAPLQRAADRGPSAAPVRTPDAPAAPRFTVDAPAGGAEGYAGGAHRPTVTDPATTRRITAPAPPDGMPAPAAAIAGTAALPQLRTADMAVQRAAVSDPAVSDPAVSDPAVSDPAGPGPDAPTLGAPVLDVPVLDVPDTPALAPLLGDAPLAPVLGADPPAGPPSAAVEPAPTSGALVPTTVPGSPPAPATGLGVQRTLGAAPAPVGPAAFHPAALRTAPATPGAGPAPVVAAVAVDGPRSAVTSVQRTSLVSLLDGAPWTADRRDGDPAVLAGLVGTRPLAAGPTADAPAARTPGNVAAVQRLPAAPPADVLRPGTTMPGAAASGATAVPPAATVSRVAATVLGATAVRTGGATASGAATVLRATAVPATGATALGTTYRTMQRTTFPTRAGSPVGAVTSGQVTDPPAVPASVQRLLVAETAARAAVQRDEETVADVAPPEVPAEPAAEPVAPATDTATAAAAPPVPPGAGSTGGVTDVDALVTRLYDPLVRRLKAELRLDRERAGHVLDLRQ